MSRRTIAVSLLVGLAAAGAWAHGSSDQSNTGPAGGYVFCPGGGSLFQSFKPATPLLASVELRLANLSGGALTTQVRIRQGSPTGPILGVASALALEPGPTHFDFLGAVAVEPESSHVIELVVPPPGGAAWYSSFTGAYPRGQGFGCSRTELPYDWAFETFGAPEPPSGPWLSSPELAGFRVKARILGTPARAGTGVDDCVADTLCVAGALANRAEVLVRVPGPKPNGYLWPTLVKFNTAPVEVWIEQVDGGAIRYYLLRGSAPEVDELPGLIDRLGFVP